MAGLSLLLGLAAGAALACATLPLDQFLHLSKPTGVVVVACALVPTTWFGYLNGLAQGSERFGLLATLAVLLGVGRSCGGLLGLALGHTTLSVLVGVALGTTVFALVATAVAPRAALRVDDPIDLRTTIRDIGHATHGHGAFLLLASLDLLLVRHVLDPDRAAVYAAGTVIERAALWLPQSVGLIVFARLTARDRHRATVRAAAALIAALGTALVLGVAASGNLVVALIGGHYERLASLGWAFAAIGSCLALLQFTMLAGLALDRPRRITLLWITMVLETVGILAVPGVNSVLGAVTLVAVVVVVAAAAGVALAVRTSTPGDDNRLAAPSTAPH